MRNFFIGLFSGPLLILVVVGVFLKLDAFFKWLKKTTDIGFFTTPDVNQIVKLMESRNRKLSGGGVGFGKMGVLFVRIRK